MMDLKQPPCDLKGHIPCKEEQREDVIQKLTEVLKGH